MSAFLQGLKIGTLTGLLNNTFSTCPIMPYSVPSWPFSSGFSVPLLYVGESVCYNIFDQSMPKLENYLPPDFKQFEQKYTWESFMPQPLNFYNTQNSWNGFVGFDTFTIKETVKPAVVNGTQNIEQKKQKEVIASYDAQELKTKWNRYKPNGTKHLPIEFFEKVISISKELDCDPNDLMAVMNLETAGTFKASIQNEHTKATGLIQFMPATANGYGTTINALAKMSEVKQLDYVRKYLLDRKKEKKIKGRIDATTLYCFIFWPAAANKKDSYVIARNNPSRQKDTYDVNKGLDINNDNVITRADLRKSVQKYIA